MCHLSSVCKELTVLMSAPPLCGAITCGAGGDSYPLGLHRRTNATTAKMIADSVYISLQVEACSILCDAAVRVTG